MPFAELALVLVLLVVVVSSGASGAAACVEVGSSPFTVEVEVVRLNPLVKGARCVSFSSVTSSVNSSTVVAAAI